MGGLLRGGGGGARGGQRVCWPPSQIIGEGELAPHPLPTLMNFIAGWSGRAMVQSNLQLIERQGPTVLEVGVGGVVWFCLISPIILLFFPSLCEI